MSEIQGPSPEQMNVEASLPPKTEVSGFDAPAEALGLQNMNFTVRRNIYDDNGNKQDGFTEETGWFVQSAHEIQDEEGNPIMVARIRKNAPDPGQTQPGTPYKDILASELQSWQHNEDEADIETVPREGLNRLKSTMGAGRQDLEGSSPVEEAKKYWYSPEEAAAIDKSKYSQPEESQDPAEQWWSQEQSQESKELAAHPEISAEVAEDVGEVAVESSEIIEEPQEESALESNDAKSQQPKNGNNEMNVDQKPKENHDSITEARAKVQEVLKKSGHEAPEVTSGTENENSTKVDLKLNQKQLDMLQSITQDIQRMSENGAPQSELDYQVGSMVNSVLIETKRLAEEGKPEPGLELAVLSLEFGAASHSDRAFNEIGKTLGKDERIMFGMFANQLDGLKRQGIKDPAEVTYHLQKQIRNALDAVEKQSSEFDKDTMRMVIMGTALGAAVEFKHKQAIFAELESTFSKQGH